MGSLFDRRTLVLALATIAATAARAKPVPKTPRILLVCQFGTVKSATARELLRQRATERHIAIDATSRGITPEQHMPAQLKARLAAEGVNPAADPLRKLELRDVARADLVIAFDPLPSTFHPRHLLDWTDTPSMVNDYAHARGVLDSRIDALLDSLAK